MAGPKFFVFDDYRWREIDYTSGSVVGWGNVRFLTVQRGRLKVAQTGSVLRGLRSLAACKPTSVHDGLPLSQIRQKLHVNRKKDHHFDFQQHHCCCRQQDLRYNSDAIFNSLLKASTSTAAVQCSLGEVNEGNEPKSSSLCTKNVPTVISYNISQEKRVLHKRKYSTSDDESEFTRKKPKSKIKKDEKELDKPLKARRLLNESLKETRHVGKKIDKPNINRRTSLSDTSSEDEVQISQQHRKSQRLNLKNPPNEREKESSNKKVKPTKIKKNERDLELDKPLAVRIPLEDSRRLTRLATSQKSDKSNIRKSTSSSGSSSEEEVQISPQHIKSNRRNLRISFTEGESESSGKKVKSTNIRKGDIVKNTKFRMSLSISDSMSKDDVQIVPKIRRSKRLNTDRSALIRDRLKDSIVTETISIQDSTSEEDDVFQGVPKKLKPSRKNQKIQSTPKSSPHKIGQKNTRSPPESKVQRQPLRSKRKLSISEDETRTERKITKYRHRKTGNNQDLDTHRIQSQESNKVICKELLISEEDISLLRTFIVRDEANIFKADLEKFDTDDAYKGNIFYKLNPLVNVARCKRIAGILRNQSPTPAVSFEYFISNLGLRSIQDTSSQASSKYRMRPRKKQDERSQTSEKELDKENNTTPKPTSSQKSPKKVLVENLRSGNKNGIVQKENTRKRAVGILGELTTKPKRLEKGDLKRASLNSDGDSVFEAKKSVQSESRTKPEIRKRSSEPARMRKGREYSRAEDEAIVAWLQGAERARRVNGNQLWRELQPLHLQRTGLPRSWHSLRNRYLRYLLPALGSLALTPPEAARLRAAAAAGELKSRKKPARRNSFLSEPRVRSAWSRRPRAPRESSPPPAPSSPSVSRAASSSPSRLASHSASPSPSDASSKARDSVPRDRRSTLKNSSLKPATTNNNKSSRRLRSSGVSVEAEVPTYSQLIRRFDDRNSTPADRTETARNTQANTQRLRTRRLYNPNT